MRYIFKIRTINLSEYKLENWTKNDYTVASMNWEKLFSFLAQNGRICSPCERCIAGCIRKGCLNFMMSVHENVGDYSG